MTFLYREIVKTIWFGDDVRAQLDDNHYLKLESEREAGVCSVSLAIFIQERSGSYLEKIRFIFDDDSKPEKIDYSSSRCFKHVQINQFILIDQLHSYSIDE